MPLVSQDAPRPIDTLDDIGRGLDALVAADPRLAPIRARAGIVPLRRTAPGFASLAAIVVAQQVSRASADAIFGRFATLIDPPTPQGVLAADDEMFRAAGLSRPKQRALRAIAGAVADGLDLVHLCSLPGDAAIEQLVAVPGIGPWTAQVYLLSAAGHPDVFPARDVALQAAVAHGLGLTERPRDRALDEIAERWAPWRSVAARLFWSYYAAIAGRDAAPTGMTAPADSAGS